MKRRILLAIFLVFTGASVNAATLHSVHSTTPIERVVGLLAELKVKTEADGKEEQRQYDKYACWCESTLSRKAADISDEKAKIEELLQLITKTKADLASHVAEIAQLKKMIAANIESQREATEVRTKENNEYEGEKAESENCIGALEAAIKVLSSAGTGKKGFLETLQEAQIIGVVAGVKSVLRTQKVTNHFSEDDIEAVQKFVAKPDDFIGAHTFGFSAAQVANNPFGDYAPQSTQIQGILKGMYDTFAGDLEKDNADEAMKQKAFEALIATKKQELKTLEATLEKQELDAAEATKTLAESKESLDDTKTQLATDEAFFAESKAACATKAEQWAERVRLRTEELNGMAQAISILSSESAKTIFHNATTTFLQVSSMNSEMGSDANKAYLRIKEIATTYRSLSLARIAVAIKIGGHFDKVITMIDKMIALLRKEDAADIAHRDRCEMLQNANDNGIEDIDSVITKTKEEIGRMENDRTALEESLKQVEGEIESTKNSMSELLDMRNQDEADFKQALKDDASAVELLGQAIQALSKFYEDNKAPAFMQDPQYTENPDKPPEIFETGSYGGQKSQTGGIVAILHMLKDDLANEMKVSRASDAKNQASYEKDNAALQSTLDAQRKKEADLNSDLAELDAKIESYTEFQKQQDGDLSASTDVKTALATDCAWVKTNFQKRADKRKLELDGLVEAKNYLAGVDAGEAVLPPASP
jgi:septal ring factor EnvC (AmiA/AmiB activator)